MMGISTLNNPSCPSCDHVFSWTAALKQVFSFKSEGTALWGAVCPECQADLRVPKARVMLIVASAVFFGSQSSTLMIVGSFSRFQIYAITLGLILGFYTIAIFTLLKLELVE